MNESHPWGEAGARSAEALDGLHAVVVVGDDPEATAEAALGLARVQAKARRVAVADLFGELPSFERLLASPPEHGLVDSFAYGVSLNQIAQPVESSDNLFLLPSGAGPIEYDTVLGSPRWPRLASGFRQVGALLIAAVPAGAPALERMLSNFDGYIALGDARLPHEHRLIRQLETPMAATAGMTAVPETHDASDALPSPAGLPAERRVRVRPSRRQLVQLVGAAAALVVLAAIGALLFYPMTSSEPVPVAEAVVAQGSENASVEDAGIAVPADTFPMVTVGNLGDSAAAAAYSVQLASHTGQTSALGHVETAADRALPAITYSPVITGPANARWYRVLAGAFTEQSGADSLLALLRRRGSVAAGQGEVRHAPFALLLERSVAREQSPTYIRDYRSRGIPAYALMQNDGTVTLYAGAFETPEQASLLLATLRERGESPQVVYRLGRVF